MRNIWHLGTVQKELLRKSVLLVIRLKQNVNYETIDYNTCNISDIFANSKPCIKCQRIINKYITKYGLRCVYYSE